MTTLAHPEDKVEKNNSSQMTSASTGERKSALPYGVGILANSILGETFGGFAYFYYVDFLGLAMASAALVRTIFTFWDVADDPIMGFLSDGTRTRWGRRRPWLFITLPLMIIVFIGVFSVPAAYQAPSKLFRYMLVILLLYETLASILWVNYSSLYPELFKSPPERTQVAVFCQTGNILGLIVALVLSPLLFQTIGYSKMAILYVLAAVMLYLVSLYFNRERPATRAQSRPAVWPILRGIVADRVFLLYALMMILTIFSTSMSVFSLPFYVKYALHQKTGIISLLSGVALISALLSMPAWNKLIRTRSLGTAFFITVSLSAFGMLGMGLAPNLPIAGIFFIVFGGAVQGINVIHIVIRGGLVSRNVSSTGSQNEGFYYGLMNSTLRMTGLLQSMAMLLIGVIFGYISGEKPGPHPDFAFRFLIGFLPVVSLLTASFFARKFFKAFTIDQTPHNS